MIFNTLTQTTLGELLSFQASRYPNQPYLCTDQKQWTYAEVELQASALAAGLRRLGLQPGERLALILPNLPEYVITFFAAAKADLVVVPVNVRRHASEVFSRLKRTGPSAVVTFSDPDFQGEGDHVAMIQDIRSELPGLSHVISLKGGGKGVTDWQDLLDETAPLPVPSARLRSPAAIVHTLGSSGEAHGAILTHGGLVRNAVAIAKTLACTPEDIFLGAVPFSNTFGLTANILVATVVNAQLVCLPKYHPGKALELIEQKQVTVHSGVPTMFALELNHPDFKSSRCRSLRTGIMSGAPCPPQLVRRVRKEMGCNLILAYGLTEASPSVTMTRLNDGPLTATETVGYPLEGIEIKVIDPEGKDLPPGETGELCVRGYNIMLGYWEEPGATEKVLDPGGWLHTGDQATIDLNGEVRIVGRIDDVINRAGFKIYPASIEMVLRSFPGVREAAVVGVPDLIYGEIICGCIVRRPEAEITSGKLLVYARDHLGDYSIPDRIVYFDALPRWGSGAIRKDYLRERVRIRGQAWKFGKNIDTDAIIPARHCNTAEPAELAQHCMEDADPNFVEKMVRGDIIVADTNFGCGSSREVAPLTIKAAGISAVIAKSFARIFFRNSINIGMPILECPQAVDGIQDGDEVEVEPSTGLIHNLTRQESYQAEPFPDFLRSIIDKGGLLAYVEERLAQSQNRSS